MTDYYVDSNASGANNGSSWTDAFADLVTADAAVTSVITDNFYIAHNHNRNYAVNTTIAMSGSFISCTSGVMPVEYQAGAVEGATGVSTYDFTFARLQGLYEIYGVTLQAEDVLSFATTGSTATCNNCILAITGTGANISLQNGGDGNTVSIINSDIKFNAIDQQWNAFGGGHLTIDNCFSTGTAVTNLFRLFDGNGGANIVVKNTDLTQLIASGGYLVDNMDSAGIDTLRISIHKCKLPQWTSWTDSTAYAVKGWEADFTNCTNPDGTDHDTYYYFEHHNFFGDRTCDTVIYPTTTVDLSINHSIRMDGVNNLIAKPLRHKIAEIPAQDRQPDYAICA